MNFNKLFVTEEKPYKGKSRRDKFLSRMFAIFSEDIVRAWCANKHSPFTDLGRPTVYDSDGKYYTLDFLLKDCNGNIFLTEMKCEIEYQKYSFLTLSHEGQLSRHRKKRAFQLLLEIASNPSMFQIKCNKKLVNVAGSALVWGRVSINDEQAFLNIYSLSHIISVESAIEDLVYWRDQTYYELIGKHELWCEQLFAGLKGEAYV